MPRLTLTLVALFASAVVGCRDWVDPGLPPARIALLKGVVTSPSPSSPGATTSIAVGAAVYSSCSDSRPSEFSSVQLDSAGGPYRLTVISHMELDTAAVCVTAWAVRTAGTRVDSVGAPPVILVFRSKGTPDSATLNFQLP